MLECEPRFTDDTLSASQKFEINPYSFILSLYTHRQLPRFAITWKTNDDSTGSIACIYCRRVSLSHVLSLMSYLLFVLLSPVIAMTCLVLLLQKRL